MEMQDIYQNIAERTNGDIYIGVVGPVRTGKSTFIKRFMDLMVLPNIENEYMKERTRDELPQSASGKTIMTTEPKFIPEEAVTIDFGNNVSCKVRMVDCVGYMVNGALGRFEGEVPRMVTTPWSDEQMPFEVAAEMGTKKVITEHSTIGVVVTTDGSITEIPREDYLLAEDRVIEEMIALKKPFVIVLNSTDPTSEECMNSAEMLEKRHSVPVIPMNCREMSSNDINQIIGAVLYEFPISEIVFKVPGWIKALDRDHWLREEMFSTIGNATAGITKLSHVKGALENCAMTPSLKKLSVMDINAGTGVARAELEAEGHLFYKIVGEETGLDLDSDRRLVEILKGLVKVSNEYKRVEEALIDVKERGYGIVRPMFDELKLEEPEIIKQGNRFGVRLKASAPTIHMIRCDVETEISPLVGTERQSEELVNYLVSEYEDQPDKIWESDIFGKSLNDLVTEGLSNKVFRMPEESQKKLRETLQRMINDGNGGLICIIV